MKRRDFLISSFCWRWIGLAAFGCLTAAQPVSGQRYLEEAIPYRNSALLRTGDGFIEAHFTRKAYMGSAEPQMAYHSYYRDSIYVTQGGYHGQPLHGKYLERYVDKGMKVLGDYAYGLKSGKWQYWDEQGMLRKVTHWKSGSETGKFSVYNENGRLQQQGYLKDGKFDGIVLTYPASSDSLEYEKKRYRKGKEVGMGDGSWFGRMYDRVRAMLF
ncbi:toxin-antitoxin system YwqK family antitoxin [Parapedobacter koreensis]|uniref:MORN repeat variant n=1 Tax=Parapedobacter koreensis TaxID=332977 RepID=A0A1H7UHK6_9SPHI|nr:hypothetical protein [Parapedobacter koreensis]SEL95727.1 hypothetical protein SAMN05421740_11541 [Parapedobacter koreensis]